jgi:hypothetical protein
MINKVNLECTPTSITSQATHITSQLTPHEANDPESLATVAQSASAAMALQTSPTTPDRSCITTEVLVDGLEVVAEQVKKEAALSKEMSRLWFSHALRTHTIRETCAELTDYRNQLAERLSEYKDLLHRTGWHVDGVSAGGGYPLHDSRSLHCQVEAFSGAEALESHHWYDLRNFGTNDR